MSGIWNPLAPELDTSPPRDSPPSTAYFVCSTHRSGSGLLCRGLVRTGLAGAPAEYFNPGKRKPLSLRWGTGRDLEAYVRALWARRTSSDGIVGAKLHWDHLESIRRELRKPVSGQEALELVERWFPGAAYVSIERTDVNRQAVSLWTAIHTGIWSAAALGAGRAC